MLPVIIRPTTSVAKYSRVHWSVGNKAACNKQHNHLANRPCQAFRSSVTSTTSSTKTTNAASAAAKAGTSTTSQQTVGNTQKKFFSSLVYDEFVVGFPYNVMRWYCHWLERSPLLTKSVTAGFIAGLGDWICQAFVENKGQIKLFRLFDQDDQKLNNSRQWDVMRTGRFTILGATLVAPVMHVWYGLLSTRILPGNSMKTVMKRVVLDQVAFAPSFLVAWLSSLWTLEGSCSTQEMPTRLKEIIPPVMVANWSLWVPAQAVNFSMVPMKFQVLFSNVVGLVWNIYLSYSTSSRDN